MDLLVAYDVRNNKRRRSIAKELEKVGLRINRSVFVCIDSALGVNEMQRLLEKLSTRKDTIFIFPLCKSCAEKAVFLQHESKPKRKRKTVII